MILDTLGLGEARLGRVPIEYWVGGFCGLVKRAWVGTSEERISQRSCCCYWRTEKVGEAAISKPKVRQGGRQVEILVEGQEGVSWCEGCLIHLVDM
jgi:hypothetical protein